MNREKYRDCFIKNKREQKHRANPKSYPHPSLILLPPPSSSLATTPPPSLSPTSAPSLSLTSVPLLRPSSPPPTTPPPSSPHRVHIAAIVLLVEIWINEGGGTDLAACNGLRRCLPMTGRNPRPRSASHIEVATWLPWATTTIVENDMAAMKDVHIG